MDSDMAFWDKERMADAVDMVEPAIRKLMEDTGRQTVCVETLGYEAQPVYKRTIGFDKKEHWAHPYDQLAHDKAELSFRTGMNTSVVIGEYPELLMPGDPRYPGGVCYDKMIVVGVSGLTGYFDELVAIWIAASIRALCKDKLRYALEKPGDTILSPEEN